MLFDTAQHILVLTMQTYTMCHAVRVMHHSHSHAVSSDMRHVDLHMCQALSVTPCAQALMGLSSCVTHCVPVMKCPLSCFTHCLYHTPCSTRHASYITCHLPQSLQLQWLPQMHIGKVPCFRFCCVTVPFIQIGICSKWHAPTSASSGCHCILACLTSSSASTGWHTACKD